MQKQSYQWFLISVYDAQNQSYVFVYSNVYKIDLLNYILL